MDSSPVAAAISRTDEDFLAFQAEGGARAVEEVEAAAAAAIVAGLGAVEGVGISGNLECERVPSSEREDLALRSKLKRGSRRSLRAANCRGAVMLPFLAVEMMMCSADLI